jgi:hypothetical protein
MNSIDTSSWWSSTTRSKIRHTFGETTSRGRAYLLSQELTSLRARKTLGAKRFQRHIHPELEIERPPDLSHASTAKKLPHLVAVGENLPQRRSVQGLLLPELRFLEGEAQKALRAKPENPGLRGNLPSAVRAAGRSLHDRPTRI